MQVRPGYYGPYCEVRVDCRQWNASQSGWATDSCSLTSEVAASYTVNERVPGTDFTWANCSCRGERGDFALTMFGLSQRWLPTSSVAMDEETLVEFGSRLVTTGEGGSRCSCSFYCWGSMARAPTRRASLRCADARRVDSAQGRGLVVGVAHKVPPAEAPLPALERRRQLLGRDPPAPDHRALQLAAADVGH